MDSRLKQVKIDQGNILLEICSIWQWFARKSYLMCLCSIIELTKILLLVSHDVCIQDEGTKISLYKNYRIR